MNLLRLFKRDKTAAAAAPTAVLNRPIVEKPASERFGKTVMPNASRVFEPTAGPLGPGSGSNFSLGRTVAPKVAPALAPATERTIALQLGDVLPQIPADLVQQTEIDPEQRLVFKAANLERGMANGRPAVSLRSVYQQAPALFREEIAEADPREIALPFHKVLEQFANYQVRVDQEADDAVPEVETPFLKVTMEDSKRFGTPVRAIRPAAPAVTPEPAVAEVVRQPEPVIVPAPSEAAPATPAVAPKITPRTPIRLSIPSEPPPAPVAPSPAPIAAPAVPKIFPHGAGVPIPERVPASSGSPAPISLPSPSAPAAAKPAPLTAPVRIPFKVTPPASDLCPPPPIALRPAATAAAPLHFSDDGPRLKISLRSVLRGIPPFQCTGPIDHVPEDAVIELPFAIVQPQLSLGRVAISPAQFHAAMPAEYRSLYKLDEGGVPVSLPLPEILQNLPNESLQIRIDQEDADVSDLFETPFSQKAAEDAARMKTPVGPIAKPAFVFAPSTEPAEFELEESFTPEPVAIAPMPAATAPPDAKAMVAQISQLPGVKACAVVFSDGLSLAGNIPDVYETDALCAMAPEIMKRMDDQMNGVNLGDLRSVTLFCEKAPVSFFAHQNICLAVLHATSSLTDEVRDRLGRTTQELAQMYAQPQLSHA